MIKKLKSLEFILTSILFISFIIFNFVLRNQENNIFTIFLPILSFAIISYFIFIKNNEQTFIPLGISLLLASFNLIYYTGDYSFSFYSGNLEVEIFPFGLLLFLFIKKHEKFINLFKNPKVTSNKK